MLTIEDDIGARRRSRGRSTTAPKYEGQSIARTWVGRLGLTSQSALVRGRLAAPLSTDDDNRRRHRRPPASPGTEHGCPHDLLVGGDTPAFARREGWTLVIGVSGYSTSLRSTEVRASPEPGSGDSGSPRGVPWIRGRLAVPLSSDAGNPRSTEIRALREPASGDSGSPRGVP
jgi:hypothetical protein